VVVGREREQGERGISEGRRQKAESRRQIKSKTMGYESNGYPSNDHRV
jgi:hypothetical protein